MIIKLRKRRICPADQEPYPDPSSNYYEWQLADSKNGTWYSVHYGRIKTGINRQHIDPEKAQLVRNMFNACNEGLVVEVHAAYNRQTRELSVKV